MIEKILGHVFQDKQLLHEALTHPGCAEQHNGVPFNYQRLEFLGDAVLGMIIAGLLFRLYPKEGEGNLAKRHAALVRSETLAGVACTLDIGQYMRMGASERGGGRNTMSNLEDVCEALIGALYLDGGMEAAERFVLAHWVPLARAVSEPPKDAKTSLQEWAQARGQALPVYTVITTEGPSHAPEFLVEASVEGGQSARAKAASKRQAEQLAAQALLKVLNQ